MKIKLKKMDMFVIAVFCAAFVMTVIMSGNIPAEEKNNNMTLEGMKFCGESGMKYFGYGFCQYENKYIKISNILRVYDNGTLYVYYGD